jgi:glutamyl-tRNA reductase
MDISLVGLNHRTAPVAIREKAAIRAGETNDALHLLGTHVPHGVILSTCNRTEVYTISNGNTGIDALRFLSDHLDETGDELAEHTYVLSGRTSVEHLFRTTCGLDSMVLGEYEVLGQVRQALEAAEKAGMVDLPLRRIFQSAVRAGRRVREETGISQNAYSVSSVAVDLVAKTVDNLNDSKMLVIGAGEAGKLVARAAHERGVSRIVVASRTHERALSLTDLIGGTPISIKHMTEELDSSDIVITCADAPHCLLDVHQVRSVMQQRPRIPLVIMDIAVPRNVEPEVGGLDNVFLYNIDDLSRISEQNRQQRETEIRKVESIIALEIEKFTAWWQEFKVRPLIRAMMSQAEEIRRSHLERTVKRLPPLDDEQRYSLEMMTRAIVAKILKNPINNLKTYGHNSRDYSDMVKDLFNLNDVKCADE